MGHLMRNPTERKRGNLFSRTCLAHLQTTSTNTLSSGVASLKAVSYIAHSRRPLTRLFCPLCLFDPDKEWTTRLRYGYYAAYLCKSQCVTRPDLATSRVYLHLHSHWSDGDNEETGIDYDVLFTCRYLPCAGDEEWNTGEYINHLHSVHGYHMVRCTRTHPCPSDEECAEDCTAEHHTSDCDLTLTGNFMYITDAKAMLEVRGTPMPPVCLVEHRRTRMVNTRVAKIRKAGRPTPEPESESEPVDEPIASTSTLPVSLDEFCQRFHIDKSGLEQLEFEPQDDHEVVALLTRADWTSAGFTTLSWNRFLSSHKKFLQDPTSRLPASTSLADFCSDYGISQRDEERLTELGYVPGDGGLTSLTEEEWLAVGFKTLSRRRILSAHTKFVAA